MLKAGFIGFGRMGITHFSILNSHPDVEIAAICDQSNTMLKILDKYVNVDTYTDYHRMLDEKELDFVVISTPTASHTEIITLAADYNLHIFAEKPFAMNSSDGTECLQRLNGKNIVHQIGYVNRFNEVFMEVKELLDENIIGNIKSFSSEMYGATVLKESKSVWRGSRKSGGGCMYEFASHAIDLALYLFGIPDFVGGSVLKSIYSANVEDIVSSTFYYEKDYFGNLFVNWSDASYRKPANIITALGTGGKIIADKHAFKIYLREPNPDKEFHAGWNTRYITDFAKSVRFYVRGNEFTRQLDYFVEKIQENVNENIASFVEGFNTDRVIEQIKVDANSAKTTNFESVQELSDPSVTIAEKIPFWKKIFSKLSRLFRGE
jgi:predicted dehydrogenase